MLKNRNVLSQFVLSMFCVVSLTASQGETQSDNFDWGFINHKDGSYFQHQESDDALLRSRLSKNKIKTPIVLFQANTSQCRIGLNDRALLQTGEADFVTSFGGNDFSCSVVTVNEKGFVGNKHKPHVQQAQPLLQQTQQQPCGCCRSKRSSSSGHAQTGLYIVPANGQFFTNGVPPIGVDGPVPDAVGDYLKFLAYSVSTVIPENRGVLTSTWVASGMQINPENAVPLFGNFIKNPNEDCRIACTGLITLDPELLLTNDWLCTNDIIYALVERLPVVGTTYASYTYVVPIFKRDPKVDPLFDFHKFQVSFDRAKGTITWILDDKPALRITQIGTRLTEENAFVFNKKGREVPLVDPIRFKILDHGGTDEIVEIINVQSGLAFFTLLDAYQPNNVSKVNDGLNIGLVRLDSAGFRTPGTFFYNDPLVNPPILPATFVQNSTFNFVTQHYEPIIPWQYRLFGQGAAMILLDYTLSIEK